MVFVGIPFGGAIPGRLLPAASSKSASGATDASHFIQTVDPAGMMISAAEADGKPTQAPRRNPKPAKCDLLILYPPERTQNLGQSRRFPGDGRHGACDNRPCGLSRFFRGIRHRREASATGRVAEREPLVRRMLVCDMRNC